MFMGLKMNDFHKALLVNGDDYSSIVDDSQMPKSNNLVNHC